MDSCVKPVIFALILAITAWDIACVSQPQRSPGSASQSFIQQESHLAPAQPGNTALGPAQQPASNPGPPTTNSGTSLAPNIPAPPNQRGATRDYVNPQNRNIQNGGRDYVNPQANRNGQNTMVAQTGGGNQRGPIRDYVNPQTGRNNPNPVAPTASNTNVQSRPGNPQTSQNFPALPGNNRGAPRDYVNPQLPTRGPQISNTQATTAKPFSYANAAGSPSNQRPNSNTRDYVAPGQRPNFPSLPGGSNPQLSPSSGVTPTPFSYAQKVSGGATTKSPAVTAKSVSTGPPTPGGPTTPKPDDGPSDVELKDFSEALLRRDTNNAAKFITANWQGKTTSQATTDEAPQKLLVIKPEAYQIPTISKLRLLHNNYILNTNENEHVTPQEKSEENELLDAMLSTPVMQYTRNFLVSKGKLAKDPKAFKDLLKVIWFGMYSRGGGRIGSSGFEHIFLAELKGNEVSGLHNWVYFDQAEMTNLADYLGYMKKIDLGEKGSIVKFRFKLNGVDKPVDSMFVGTSPELEMALYTTCYLFRENRICPLRLNGNNFIIRTYNFRYRGKNMIGSAFPEI